MKHTIILAIAGAAFALTGCSSTLEKIEQIGKIPEHSKIENPQAQPGYRPMTWPLPKAAEQQDRHANSLWEPGARAFFRDQRATRVGDILRVRVAIDDRAEIENETENDRDTSKSLGIPSLFGLGELFAANPFTSVDPANLVEIDGSSSSSATGTIEREEQIDTEIAALVTQVLPNGNLVIQGRQEVRVNYELRELTVAGVIRKEDIDMDNTIDSSQIAEARISYGGRGQISNPQKPRWGEEALDIFSAF